MTKQVFSRLYHVQRLRSYRNWVSLTLESFNFDSPSLKLIIFACIVRAYETPSQAEHISSRQTLFAFGRCLHTSICQKCDPNQWDKVNSCWFNAKSIIRKYKLPKNTLWPILMCFDHISAAATTTTTEQEVYHNH